MLALVTDNEAKFAEYVQILGRHGARVVRWPRAEFDEDALSERFAQDPKLEAVLRESSNLERADNGEVIVHWRDPALALIPVRNVARLVAWTRDDRGAVRRDEFESVVDGWLDPAASARAKNAFAWDSVFRTQSLARSYHELRVAGLKHSARDRVLAQFAMARLYLSERVDLAHSPQRLTQTIDFSRDVMEFVRAHPLLSKLDPSRAGVRRILESVVGDGVFFRAAHNRRERNYWLPGLNAGLPLTPKRDPVHEVTFLVHDFMHFAQSDLLFTGDFGGDPAVARNVYTAWRMLSEAASLVLADMLFVRELDRANVEYDFAKRRIYPLFRALDVDADRGFVAAMKALIRANARYALLGDTAGFDALARDATSPAYVEALANYRAKYDGYFRADYRWTAANFDEMAARSELFRRWYALVGERRCAALGLVTLDAMVRRLRSIDDAALSSLEGTFELVLDQVLALFEARATSERRPHDPAAATQRAFSRWVLGQCMMFAAWDFVPRSKPTAEAILATIDGAVDPSVIDRVRARLEAHIASLVADGMLSEDDRRTFNGVFPLFEPRFVSYDRATSPDDTLARAARECFTQRAPSATAPAAIDLQRWFSAATGLPQRDRLRALLASAGVSFHDAEQRFVRAPSAALVALGGLSITIEPNDAPSLLASNDAAQTFWPRVRASQHASMGFGAVMTYLDPKDRGAAALAEAAIAQGHASIAHIASVTLLVAGFSTAVANELNGQRDLVHLARLTEARTEAQSDPPLCVLCEEDVALYRALRDERARFVDSAKQITADRALTLESINLSHPAAKATLALVTGTLRNLQKLVSAIDDSGREEEYRRVLVAINDALAPLHPALFRPSASYAFRPTWKRSAP